jgi:hypothetical protein
MKDLNSSQKIILNIISFFLIFLFIYGFLIGENSAGAGGYNGDLLATFSNLQLFINNNFYQAIKLTANSEVYYSNRPPLFYILHSIFNPVAGDLKKYIYSVFFISSLVPIFFYLSLKINYKKISGYYLFFLSCLILLSPYFRTSSYWGLEENYAFISLLLSFIFIKKFLFKKKFLDLFLTIFFSSTCVYFDQKFIIIPLICFLQLTLSELSIKFKLYTIFLYSIFSLPFIYLIYLWGNIIPVGNMNIYSVGKRIYLQHICYMTNILGLYFFPFLILIRKKDIKKILTSFFKNKINKFFLLIGILYISYFIFFADLTSTFNFGGGYSLKVARFLFNIELYQKIFLSIIFFFCIIILLIFININYWILVFIIYFLISSLLINPVMHEYLDPLVLVFFLTFAKNIISIDQKKVFFLLFYFLIIFTIARIYY